MVSGAEVAGDLKNTMAAKETKSDFRMHIHNNEFDNIPDPPQAKSREPRRRPQRQSVLDGRFGGLIRFAQSFSAVLIVLGISAFLAYFTLVSASDLFGLNQPDEQVTVTIPKDASYNDFIRLLGDSGVVDQPFTFRLYAGFKNLGDSFRGGVYTMNKDFSYDEIIDLLTRGDGSDIARITIIEGMTINNIADKLEEENVCSAKDFLEALNTGDFEYEFMKDVPKSPLRFHEYEGYMFPDTYEFYMGEQPMTVVKKFFANFQKRVYKENILERMENSGMSMDEVITLASVIQKESGTFADMEKVSSIFHNRLAADSPYPLLQSDVTIFYVNDNIKPTDSQENPNQEMYDAYNTYVKHGLPVGPICNPGMEAIEAALAPAETEFYFFVTDAEGTYYYAKTLEEHERNCNIAKAKGEMVGVATEKPETE